VTDDNILTFPGRFDRRQIEIQIGRLQRMLRRRSGRPPKDACAYLQFYLSWTSDIARKPRTPPIVRRQQFIRKRVAEQFGLRVGSESSFYAALQRGRRELNHFAIRMTERRGRISLLGPFEAKERPLGLLAGLVTLVPK
jgi:hypothetical protein